MLYFIIFLYGHFNGKVAVYDVFIQVTWKLPQPLTAHTHAHTHTHTQTLTHTHIHTHTHTHTDRNTYINAYKNT